MTTGLKVLLLLFALVGYLGAGAAFAAARYRRLREAERDLGMFGVALMLLVFGLLCTAAGVGASGILAVGVVAVWASYVVMAQSLGLFRVELARFLERQEEAAEETRRAK
jgi:hypothetical protein